MILNKKAETIKFLEETAGEYLYNLKLSKYFLQRTQVQYELKNKINEDKWAKVLNRHFIKEDLREKVNKLTSHQGNRNENHKEIPFHTH